MTLSIFDDKEKQPTEKDLQKVLGEKYEIWNAIKAFVVKNYPEASEQWNFSGKAYGWGFRLRDKKRVIIYLTPCDGFFKTSLVFGQKAFDEIMKNKISIEIKNLLEEAPVYAEGRGFRIDVIDNKFLKDIQQLILKKLKY
ncbi:MAG: DUF3788 domain-containing protein [Bacteroidota bacterium]